MDTHNEIIVKKARDIYLNSTFLSIPGREFDVVMHHDRFLAIFHLISDNGCLHISTEEDMRDRVNELATAVAKDSNIAVDVLDWLLLASTTFMFTAFETKSDYKEWVSELAESYSIHTEFNQGPEHNLLPEDYFEQMPVIEEYDELLQANPWFVFILTLQLSYSDIIERAFSGNMKQIKEQFDNPVEEKS